MNARDRRAQRRAALSRERPSDLVQVARSFSRKIQIVQYQPVDFFCSLSLQCYAEDAAVKSQQAVEFCKKQVQADISAYRNNLVEPLPRPSSSQPAAQANAREFERRNGPTPLQQKLDQGKV